MWLWNLIVLPVFPDSADSTTINSITCIMSHEVAAVTFGGQLKVWDLRQPGNKPGRTMLLWVSIKHWL